MTTTAKAVAGSVALLAMLAFGYLGAQYGLGAYDDDYRVSVVLGELGQGIVEGSDVKIRGVLVGSVGEIELTDDLQAVVELVLEPDVRVPERAVFAVTGKTLLGEKQVEIEFDGPLAEGPHMDPGTLVADADRVVELQDVLADLTELFEALDPEDLAVLIDDGLGAFDGQGPVIARSIDEGARASEVFSRSLDDQVPAIRDLSLVAETLGPTGPEFNRMAGEMNAGFPTLTDNQLAFRSLLGDLDRFAVTLDATLTVDRANIDRMIVQGDSITRMLFAYHPEMGELLTGVADYMEKFSGGGFNAPDVIGEAAPFQLLITTLDEEICHNLPAELTDPLPICGGDGGRITPPDAPVDLPLPVLPNDSESELLRVPAPPGLLTPEVPTRLGIDSLARSALQGVPGATREDGR